MYFITRGETGKLDLSNWEYLHPDIPAIHLTETITNPVLPFSSVAAARDKKEVQW